MDVRLRRRRPSEPATDFDGRTHHCEPDAAGRVEGPHTWTDPLELFGCPRKDGAHLNSANRPPTSSPQQTGKESNLFGYHEAFTDGRYVYDPELSIISAPMGDYEREFRHGDEGGKISRRK